MMEKKPPNPPAKAIVLVGKGPPPAKGGLPGGGTPGAKPPPLSSSPPPGKPVPPKPGAPGSAAPPMPSQPGSVSPPKKPVESSAGSGPPKPPSAGPLKPGEPKQAASPPAKETPKFSASPVDAKLSKERPKSPLSPKGSPAGANLSKEPSKAPFLPKDSPAGANLSKGPPKAPLPPKDSPAGAKVSKEPPKAPLPPKDSPAGAKVSKELPKAPLPPKDSPAGAKVSKEPPKPSLPPKDSSINAKLSKSPPKSPLPFKEPQMSAKTPLSKSPTPPEKVAAGVPSAKGPLSPSPKPPVPATKEAPAVPPAGIPKSAPKDANGKAAGLPTGPVPPVAPKGLTPQSSQKAPNGLLSKPTAAALPKAPAKQQPVSLGGKPAAGTLLQKSGLPSPASPVSGGPSAAAVGLPAGGSGGAAVKSGAAILPNPADSSLDEFGRQRGSVGTLTPSSLLTQDLAGNVPVFDKEGNFVAYATGPPAPLSRMDPSRRRGRLADLRPQDRDTMKGSTERGLNPGALGGVTVPGGVPGFFLSVPPWPAPTPLPMDQVYDWGYGSQFMGYPQPQVSPYAAYFPQPVEQGPYQMVYGHGQGLGEVPYSEPQQGRAQGPSWSGYPTQQEAHGASSSVGKDRGLNGVSGAAPTEPSSQKEGRIPRSSIAQFDPTPARGYGMPRADEIGKNKWSPVERHLNNIRGGYGEGSRPPEEADEPPRRPSAKTRHRSSSTRDDVYSGFRPYYVRDKKPYVDEVIPRSGEPQEVSGGKPVLPKKTTFLSRPKERTWDRWGSTGLTAPRKRAYQSLSELASCFSNLEPEDQDDVISLLLLCRKLEQQVEKQHVVIDMLEHDLSEAQKVLKFPPEWRTLEGVDFAGMTPSDTPFQATAATPLYIKNVNFLPANVPDEPNANFGVGVPLTSPGAAAPAKAPGAAAAHGPAKANPTTASTPHKGPAPGLKAPKLMKKPVFKKM